MLDVLAQAAAAPIATAPPFTIEEQAPRRVTVRPQRDHAPQRNPGKGWLIYEFEPVHYPRWTVKPGECPWRDEFSPGGEPSYRGADRSDGAPPFTPLASAVYTNYYTWADLEPAEGQYRWYLIDQFVAEWRRKGLKARIGIHLTDPTSIKGGVHIPHWVFADPRMSGRWYSKWYGIAIDAKGTNGCAMEYEPDYWNPFFLEKWSRFLAAFGQRYARQDLTGWEQPWHQWIEAFDISAYGYWGEWHSEIRWPSRDVKRRTLRTLVDRYFEVFPPGFHPELTMNVIGGSAADDLEESDVSAVKHAIRRGASMIRRNIGAPIDYVDRRTGRVIDTLSDDERTIIAANVGRRRFIGEWGSFDGDISRFTFPNTSYTLTTEQAMMRALRSGISLLGWYQHPPLQRSSTLSPGETLEEFFQNRAGYRFTLAAVSHPTSFMRQQGETIGLEIENLGLGRHYDRRHTLAVMIAPGSGKPRVVGRSDLALDRIAGGERRRAAVALSIPADVEPGAYDLFVGVIDSRTGEAAMNLANKGREHVNALGYGLYRIASVAVR